MVDDLRYYVVLRAADDVQRQYKAENQDGIVRYIAEQLTHPELARDHLITIKQEILPSNMVEAHTKGPHDLFPVDDSKIAHLVVPLTISNHDALAIIAKGVEENTAAFLGGGSDVPFSGADHWCPSEAWDPIFADRAAAERLIGVDYLKGQSGTTGQGVNVVVVDEGLNQARLGSAYGSGWNVGSVLPGTAEPDPGSIRRNHGMMIAHNIQQVARDVTFFDLPVVPWKISNVPAFLSTAQALFQTMLYDIKNYRLGGKWSGPWVIVNPWAIFDTKTDLPPPNDYVNNPTHIFNQTIAGAVNNGIDVVFAAGNCGQFCPDFRCGGLDIGPGHSICGANSIAEVLTVGAVRADTKWLGYSSQGPGQSNLAHDKPDLCAASQFCDIDDAFSVNTGTSAACALATGVVASLRSTPSGAGLSPQQLKALLIATARKIDSSVWNDRTGNGILDARAAYDALP